MGLCYNERIATNEPGDESMNFLHYIGGPLVGAVIGYCTNYVAVKMLFRPLKEVKIGRFTLPFTPGIIPKRKNDLAAAVGKAVGDSLLTRSDLETMLLSEEMEDSIVEMCMTQIRDYMNSQETLETAVSSLTGEDAYKRMRELLLQKINNKIMDAIREMQPAELIAQEGRNAVKEKIQGTMFAMFISDQLLDSLGSEIGTYAENYILENGPGFIAEQMEKETADLENKSLREIKEKVSPGSEAVRARIRKVYRSCIERFASSIVSEFHIAEIVEKKIRDMDVMELENLVMSVMKHELGMIVNLGALIGLVLGILNLFF
jgi:uncharacterized membrane protein YheB (UPF0754 family)